MRALGSGTLLISSLAQISRVATWEAERPERMTGCSWGALGSGARPRQSPRGQGVGPTGEPQDGASGHTPPIPPDSPTPRGRNVCSCSGKLRRRAEGTPSGGSCSKGRPQSGRLEDPATQSWGLGKHVHEPPVLARRPQVPGLGQCLLQNFATVASPAAGVQ